MGKVLVTGSSVRAEILAKFVENGHEFEVVERAEDLSEAELLEKFVGVDAYLCGGDERTDRVIYDASPNLKVIAFLGVGYAAFMNEADATNAGIAITNTPGTLTESVAEATVALTLSLNRRIIEANSAILNGVVFNTKCSDISEKTVGVLGMGSIGTRIAQALFHAFRCKILYHNRSQVDLESLNFQAEYVSKEALFSDSDIVVIMATGSPENYGLVGEHELRLMKSGAILVNTARPELVDGAALAKVLEGPELAGVAIDGYYNDDDFDLSRDEFGMLSLSNRNVVVTPHLGSLTHNARDKMGEMAVEAIVEFLRSGDGDNIVNPDFRSNSRWSFK